jgi:hypothetical protein
MRLCAISGGIQLFLYKACSVGIFRGSLAFLQLACDGLSGDADFEFVSKM